jgi:hypothetical protein
VKLEGHVCLADESTHMSGCEIQNRAETAQTFEAHEAPLGHGILRLRVSCPRVLLHVCVLCASGQGHRISIDRSRFKNLLQVGEFEKESVRIET